MELISHIRSIYDYEFWATAQVQASLEEMQPPSERAIQQQAHILLARRAWLTRLEKGESFDIDIWPVIENPQEWLPRLRQLAGETESAMRALLDSLSTEGLLRVYEYQNYSRAAQSRRLLDILSHVANHGTYHRGFISQFVRQDGGTPRGTDYIIYAAQLR